MRPARPGSAYAPTPEATAPLVTDLAVHMRAAQFFCGMSASERIVVRMPRAYDGICESSCPCGRMVDGTGASAEWWFGERCRLMQEWQF